ncbi:MAG: ABC transporter ATP-binding protein [Dysgonamonadaceae bacterium]|jgi:ATP-binding cassette subfamily B protein|nr:ABC transporter ATP-binding protein [Dysgonamonadaceae bacterium]MDD3355464.1 ABC transporter ATP-binding protein [Dysgonamonadaceae bacterium]MDD3726772.1 ABC transporter ATP-binding protein [Dysgonamonadaceae bacterium]MDD4247106.1 ABC transporter ATP-binding protein [Dysgonamonadaceae bacterium]MDD4605472.1 ABC transporter ATP-binding protein [Dysgonamonadaceae bacterium]
MNRNNIQSEPEKEKNTNLFGVLKPYKGMVSMLVIIAMTASGINLVIPKIIGSAIDAFSANNFDIVKVITQFLLAATGIFIFTALQGVLQTFTAERVARDLRNKIVAKLSHQSLSFIIGSNPSKLLTNLTSDMDSVKTFVAQAFVAIISSFFVIIGVAVLMLMINLKLALAVLGIVPIIGTAFYIVFWKARNIFRKSRQVIDALNKIINESILGAALIRVLNSQQPENQKFLEKNMESRNLGLSIVRLFSILVPSIMFVSNLAIVLILALGGHYVVMDTMTIGDFAAFNSYVVMLIFPVMLIGFMSNVIASATASNERIQSILSTPPPQEEGTIKSEVKGNILLKNVSLTYEDKPILKNVSFSVKAGSKTAIIGPTAAGKSQLLYLLTNLIPADSGTIEMDGISIDKYARETLYKDVGLVFQDSVLFNMSLEENIGFSDSVTEEALQKAIETAELSNFIESLPQKLETIVSERGSSLSGGQKQRIMLARALTLNPNILLLDDFTARVDQKTEDRILANIQSNYPDLTLISITQKIEPVKDFDQILLLMGGEIIASGQHKDLMKRSPEYIQIYKSQQSTEQYEL